MCFNIFCCVFLPVRDARAISAASRPKFESYLYSAVQNSRPENASRIAPTRANPNPVQSCWHREAEITAAHAVDEPCGPKTSSPRAAADN